MQLIKVILLYIIFYLPLPLLCKASHNKGERIFITAKLPRYIKLGGKDEIELYLFLTTSHDGAGSIIIGLTPIRIVCNNTLNAAIRGCQNMVKIRHTATAHERLMKAHETLGMVNTAAALIEQVFNRWTKVRITDAEVKALIVKAMNPSKEVIDTIMKKGWNEVNTRFKNQIEEVYGYAVGSPTQQLETTAGTLFGAYNAVTGYFQNVRSYKNDDHKMDSLFYGGSAQQKGQRAFDLCMDFMEIGSDALFLN